MSAKSQSMINSMNWSNDKDIMFKKTFEHYVKCGIIQFDDTSRTTVINDGTYYHPYSNRTWGPPCDTYNEAMFWAKSI